MRASGRVEGEDDKRAPADFALWKAAKPGEPAWDAPFGRGRPGWHIECSAMIEKTLGRTIDIHGGGIDLLFPHHENEIAQSECAHGAPLARVWLHNGFLTMDAEKMSKSVGNVLLAHELLQRWPGEVLRLALLSAHYRAPLDWTEDLLKQADATLKGLYGAVDRLNDVSPEGDVEPSDDFLDALCDDLNTPMAMAALSTLATDANKAKSESEKATAKARLLKAGEMLGLLQRDPDIVFGRKVNASLNATLGNLQLHATATVDWPAEKIDALVSARFAARRAKNFAEADRIREELTEMGVIVMDGPEGSTWRRA